MADTVASYKHQIAEFREKLSYVEGASGVVVAVGKQTVALDLFDKPATCQKVWDRLLTGFVLDALEVPEDDEELGEPDVEKFVATLNDAPWKQVNPVGEGEEHRAEMETGDHAFRLSLDGSLIHASVLAGE